MVRSESKYVRSQRLLALLNCSKRTEFKDDPAASLPVRNRYIILRAMAKITWRSTQTCSMGLYLFAKQLLLLININVWAQLCYAYSHSLRLGYAMAMAYAMEIVALKLQSLALSLAKVKGKQNACFGGYASKS